MNCWTILKIEPTNDIKVIKRAYAKQLKIYHPEECPKEFETLQWAYETALKIAKGSNKEAIVNSTDLQETPQRQTKTSPHSFQYRHPEVEAEEKYTREYFDKLIGKEGKNSEREKKTEEDEKEAYFDALIDKQLAENKIENEKILQEQKSAFDDIFSGEKRYNIKAWKEYIKTSIFIDALQDSEFIWFINNRLELHGKEIPTSAVYEIYFSFVKNKHPQEWEKIDHRLHTTFMGIFFNLRRYQAFLYGKIGFVCLVIIFLLWHLPRA